ncbi:MAG: hypothetical protein GF416_06755 [Candidatus Altiarchaeales archaeon]|nr:hypothetical protein [Candidatus Altiarchaeales archaeon]MBD3416813.1 hypothetical protein [Candidatus Altiarchaeales archaeon]
MRGIRGFLLRVSFLRRPARPGRGMLVLLGGFLAAISLGFYAFFIEPCWIEVNTVELRTHKLDNAGFRVVQISDLHCDVKVRNEYRLGELINPLEPDVIVFTGDMLNTEDALPTCREGLNRLKAKSGKYAVYGNWDVWYFDKTTLFEDTSFRVLDGEGIDVVKDGEKIQITGVGYDRGDMAYDILDDVGDDEYSILLYHTPDLVEGLQGLNVDLYLAGHTHGGQVAMPFYGAIITLAKHGKKYESGEYNVGETTLYVNRGIGMEGGHMPRVRFLARPEVTVFNIKPQG